MNPDEVCNELIAVIQKYNLNPLETVAIAFTLLRVVIKWMIRTQDFEKSEIINGAKVSFDILIESMNKL